MGSGGSAGHGTGPSAASVNTDALAAIKAQDKWEPRTFNRPLKHWLTDQSPKVPEAAAKAISDGKWETPSWRFRLVFRKRFDMFEFWSNEMSNVFLFVILFGSFCL